MKEERLPIVAVCPECRQKLTERDKLRHRCFRAHLDDIEHKLKEMEKHEGLRHHHTFVSPLKY